MSETRTYNPIPSGKPPVKESKSKTSSEPSMTKRGNTDKRDGGTFMESRAKKNGASNPG
jgi:hypothetical protein